MRQADKNIDAIIFDYLEGNMSNNDRLNFESSLQSNIELRDELSIWQATYVEGDFADTSAIEPELIQKSNPAFGFNFYLNTILILCLTFVSTGRRYYEEVPVIVNQALKLPKLESSINKPSIKIWNLDQPEKEIPITSARHVESKPIKKGEEHIRERISVEYSNINSLFLIPDQQVLASDHPKIIGVTFEVSKESRVKTKAKPQIKKKMKRRYMFIKGDAPYVVPLDTQNF